MAPVIYLTYGDRTVLTARPATYEDLLREIRIHYPMLGSVDSLVVLFRPAQTNIDLQNKWVEIDPSAYGAIHEGAELIINVLQPLTKEYILPLPAQLDSDRRIGKKVPQTDNFGNHSGVDAPALDQVSTNKHKDSSYRNANSMLSVHLERPGGDAFARGWGDASERFRRSAKLVPDIKDCKAAVGQIVGQSNFYPDDEEKQAADHTQGWHQVQTAATMPTEAGWYAGGEENASQADPFATEARHLSGGQDDDEDAAAGPGLDAEDDHTNGTNGDLTNGYHVHHQVSQNPQHPDRNIGTSDWSPPRPQYKGYHQAQTPRMGGNPAAPPKFTFVARPRLRHDPAEVTYGSPKPRVQGSATGWTTIGRKNNNWTNKSLQEDDHYEQSNGLADNSAHTANHHDSWYGPPPPNRFDKATGHGNDREAFTLSSGWYVQDVANKSQQNQSMGNKHW
ncbi:hypothetical protein diail_2644 [Diaporthe ilicicola]|nr:hypothetical protein diail_2644 [Diaporthe ilicicola]